MANFMDLELIMDTNICRANAFSSFEFEQSRIEPSRGNAEKGSLANVQLNQVDASVGAGDEEAEEALKGVAVDSDSLGLNSVLGAASLSLGLSNLLSLNSIAAPTAAPPSRALRLGFAPALPKNVVAKPKTKSAAVEDTSAKKALNPSPVVGSAKVLSETSTSVIGQEKIGSKAGSFVTPFPEFNRLAGRQFGEPKNNPAALRKATIVWFRHDLRVHDNEALVQASNDSVSMLPVYCFDPRDYGKSSSGFDKTGPYRAKFLLECVANLRESLRERGSDLVVRMGKAEDVLPALAKSVGADALYTHQEVTHEEMNAEGKVRAALKEEGVESKFFWGSTLFHIDDLPFKLAEMPSNYGGFREKVQGVEVRPIIPSPKHLKGLPIRGGVKAGEIPTLQELGLNPAAAVRADYGVSEARPGLGGKAESQVGRTVNSEEKRTAYAGALLIGGEVEALERLKSFSGEASGVSSSKNGETRKTGESIYGANFSCKISPWLAMGCLSPRRMFEDLKRSSKRVISASTNTNNGNDPEDEGMNWLIFELLWRDFFRFITKKFGESKKANEVAPVTSCTGNLSPA